MPRSRPTRSRKVIDSPQASESENENEYEEEVQDEPSARSRKSKLKRRASSNFALAADASFASSSGGGGDAAAKRTASNLASTSELSVNDDAMERRRRRKSTRMGPPGGGEQPDEPEAQAGPSRPTTPDRDAPRTGPKTPRVTALARANELNSIDRTPMPAVSMDVMSSNFEEWMKMATDNKINATNSWNFALIDYFHDMSLLRNELDNSINFQKASFTLDGCVKIWTSRVDSVGTETGKLLSNLANEGRGDDEEQEEGAEGEGPEGEKPKKRKAHRAEATLAKSYTQLQVKKLDLEFTVDPLFKKTSSDFDEGGAMGLLMNHLGVDKQMRVVFDAGDTKLADEEDEGEVIDTVELGDIRANFLPDLDSLEDKTISQTLADFCFSSDQFNLDMSYLNATHESIRDDLSSNGGDDGGGLDDFDFGGGGGGGDVEDFFVGDQAIEDLGGGGDGGFGIAGEEGAGGPATATGPFVPFDPRKVPNERDLIMAMTQDGEEMLDYFDANFMKNWAGPEHWKVRRVVKRVAEPDAEGGTGAAKPKREKASTKISFLDPPTAAVTAKQLFAPAGKAVIVLPAKTGAAAPVSANRRKSKKVVKRDDHTLPDDMHFSSRQLLRLFLKPKFTLKMRRQGVPGDDAGDGEVDEHFWAQAAAEQAAAAAQADDDMDDTHGDPAPFNTQFFHDDDYDDGPGFDDGGGDDVGGLGVGHGSMEEEDLLAATQGQLKRVRPEFVNYAKKAKRVDVKKLKENIWKGLDIVVADPEAEAEVEEDEERAQNRQLTDPQEAREFNSVIQTLRSSYPKDKMEEISTSFCFICLLHLANERGLKIEVPEKSGGDDDEEDAKRVGDIWGLRVYRDPSATQLA
ncbi:hypothetical protein BOTBODRAFT_28583 [Botryobasidium botryosum FD-172 SS1]|uniref:Condensin complex subunit 2 n=1 Tax=Botryobasidium botryosum (strain FD-172 SS1) TaxID=930990 RepID=A0A067MWK7_BOTB1|nr:hypothetical protein BOTBODRAFT_28583 [Botryobasidium botryosum FD-172 SS1]